MNARRSIQTKMMLTADDQLNYYFIFNKLDNHNLQLNTIVVTFKVLHFMTSYSLTINMYLLHFLKFYDVKVMCE